MNTSNETCAGCGTVFPLDELFADENGKPLCADCDAEHRNAQASAAEHVCNPTEKQSTFISMIYSEHTGGGCMVDYIVMKNGRVITLTAESVAAWMDQAAADAFDYEGKPNKHMGSIDITEPCPYIARASKEHDRGRVTVALKENNFRLKDDFPDYASAYAWIAERMVSKQWCKEHHRWACSRHPMTEKQKKARIARLEEIGAIKPDCTFCQEVFYSHPKIDPHAPRHTASAGCESGKYPHCSCDTCF